MLMNNIINFFESQSMTFYINILIAIAIVLFFQIFAKLLTKFVFFIFKIKLKKDKKIKSSNLYMPISYFFRVTGLYLAILFLKVPPELLAFCTKTYKILLILIVTKGLANCLDEKSDVFAKIQKKFKFSKSDSSLSIFTKIAKIIIYIIGGVLILFELGYNLNGLLASFGLFGVIITLAAQDTAKNLFGGVVLLLDKPFLAGQWIEIEESKIEGIVEDISLRSTRIRTFKDSLIVIPNSTISNASIINWSKMKRRKITLDFDLSFDTTLIKVNNVVDKIHLMLQEHEHVLNDEMYINFEQITTIGFKIKVAYFITNTTYFDYLNIKENVNYKIMQIINSEKVSFSHDLNDIFIKK